MLHTQVTQGEGIRSADVSGTNKSVLRVPKLVYHTAQSLILPI